MNRIIRSISILLLAALLLSLPLCAFAADNSSAAKAASTMEDLRGQKIGVLTGGVTGQYVQEYYNGEVEAVYYNALADMIAAAKSGKIAGFVHDSIAAQVAVETEGGLKILDGALKTLDVGFCFRKDEASAALCAELSEFLDRYHAEGLLDELLTKWLGKDESVKDLDRTLSGENGTLTLACAAAIGVPACYARDGEFVGYDIELAYRFCREKGYGLTLLDTDAGNGIVTAVAAGKADFGGTNLPITEERKEAALFSSVYNNLDFVIVVPTAAAESESNGFAAGIASSFRRTFLEESRWKLFSAGIGRTLLITVLSAMLGTVIGFILFMLCRNGGKLINSFVDALMWLIHGMPVVVLLMVLYYIVFGKTSIDGMWVSVVAFTLVFACAFIAMMRQGTLAVNPGQMEAARALGYSERKAYIRRILPQAAQHFMPTYQAELVSLIKATAIVGYISVQDVTKASDLIRARTFEAFFPLIATAVMYFLLALVLSAVVKFAMHRLDPKRRSMNRILRGVKQP